MSTIERPLTRAELHFAVITRSARRVQTLDKFSAASIELPFTDEKNFRPYLMKEFVQSPHPMISRVLSAVPRCARAPPINVKSSIARS